MTMQPIENLHRFKSNQATLSFCLVGLISF